METNTHVVQKKSREQDRDGFSEAALGFLHTGQGQHALAETNLRHELLAGEGDYKPQKPFYPKFVADVSQIPPNTACRTGIRSYNLHLLSPAVPPVCLPPLLLKHLTSCLQKKKKRKKNPSACTFF